MESNNEKLIELIQNELDLLKKDLELYGTDTDKYKELSIRIKQLEGSHYTLTHPDVTIDDVSHIGIMDNLRMQWMASKKIEENNLQRLFKSFQEKKVGENLYHTRTNQIKKIFDTVDWLFEYCDELEKSKVVYNSPVINLRKSLQEDAYIDEISRLKKRINELETIVAYNGIPRDTQDQIKTHTHLKDVFKKHNGTKVFSDVFKYWVEAKCLDKDLLVRDEVMIAMKARNLDQARINYPDVEFPVETEDQKQLNRNFTRPAQKSVKSIVQEADLDVSEYWSQNSSKPFKAPF